MLNLIDDTAQGTDARLLDTVGWISISDAISRDQARTIARRTIPPSDLHKWPGLTVNDASSSETCLAFIGPTAADTHSVKWRHSLFRDVSGNSNDCRCMVASADGTLLAASFNSGTVLVWQLSDGLLVRRLPDHGHTGWKRPVAFSPNAHHLVAGSSDYTVVIWDIRTSLSLLRLEGLDDKVVVVAYSPDGSRIAAGSEEGGVTIWDAFDGTCLHSLDLGEEIFEIIFSPESSRLAIRFRAGGAIYDVHTGTNITIFRHSRGIRLAWSPQGDRIITGTGGGRAKISNSATGEALLELEGHRDTIRSVAFSREGTQVATASDDRTVVTCDSWAGQRHRVYHMPSIVRRVAYSSKGEYIAMGDNGGRVRVCEAKSGVFVAEFRGHTDRIWELMFVPNSLDLLSRSHNGGVRLWSIRDAMRVR